MTRRARLEQALVDLVLITILVGTESLLGLATWAATGVITHDHDQPGPVRALVLLVAALLALPCLWVYVYSHLAIDAVIGPAVGLDVDVPAPRPATRPTPATYHSAHGRHQTGRRPAPKGGIPT